MKIKCKLCGSTSEIPVANAKKESLKHDGFIPCPKCGSRATKWNPEDLGSK